MLVDLSGIHDPVAADTCPGAQGGSGVLEAPLSVLVVASRSGVRQPGGSRRSKLEGKGMHIHCPQLYPPPSHQLWNHTPQLILNSHSHSGLTRFCFWHILSLPEWERRGVLVHLTGGT